MTDGGDKTLSDLPAPEYDGTLPPDDLHVDGDNPNEMTDEQFGLLVDRMAENGWLGGPIITDTDGLIADGEHRWRAAQEIGLSEVPVKQYAIDDSKRRLWRQELNKIHGEHDTKRDALEYDHLLSNGHTEEVEQLTDAAGEDLDELLDELKVDNSRPAEYEYDPDHNVYFEDCVEGMRKHLPDDSVDCVITDPPYTFDMTRHEIDSIEGAGDGSKELVRSALSEAARALRPGGHIYVFWPWRDYGFMEHEFDSCFKHINTLACVKDSIGLGGNNDYGYRYQYELCLFGAATGDDPRPLASPRQVGDVFEYERPAEHDHPTEKPVNLVSDFVEESTLPGDTILDPFMGSGTTAVAAIQNDREYVGFEVDAENYREVIERRIGEAKRQREAAVNQEDSE